MKINYKSLLFAILLGIAFVAPIGAYADSAPTCVLNADKDSIVDGESVLLNWSTSGATTVSLDGGIGVVSPVGSKSVKPTNTTTYTLTAQNSSGSTVCSKEVTVLAKTAKPTCEFTATPNSVTSSADIVKLDWKTAGANSVYINNGIGYVNKNGNLSLRGFTNKMDYVLTAVNANGITECNVHISSNQSRAQNLSCNIVATPNSVSYNGSVVLQWTSKGATSATIDNGVGYVQKNGSKIVEHITKTTTFKLVVKNGTDSANCSVTVYRDTSPNTPAPTCEINIDPNIIDSYGKALLKWNAYHSNYAFINNGVGQVNKTGSVYISPNSSTTYVMTVKDSMGRTGFCSKTITVKGSGSIVVGSTLSAGNYNGGYGTQYNTFGYSYNSNTYNQNRYGGGANVLRINSIPYTGAGDELYIIALIMLAIGSYFTAFKLGKKVF